MWLNVIKGRLELVLNMGARNQNGMASMSDDLVPAGTRAGTHVQYNKANCRPGQITTASPAPGV